MKKLFAILALALLAVSGTGYAVTCAYDNVPAATLLVPYWKVTLNDTSTDTLVSIVNVSTPGVIVHVTVWNKYSRAVLDFNVPLTGTDVAFFSMRDVMNGNLNVNPLTQVTPDADACGIDLSTNTFDPVVGFGQAEYIRFTHPEFDCLPLKNCDPYQSISKYAADAFATFRGHVWDSLDESGDINAFTSPGTNVLDGDNPACDTSIPFNGDGTISGVLSGYLTLDVVNFCTNYFPSDAQFYTEDAIATVGWGPGGPHGVGGTPNVLIGDVFYLDSSAQGGNISGDPAVAVEFDDRLGYDTGARTFFGKFVKKNAAACGGAEILLGGCPNPHGPTFAFSGDGREPLGDRYGFRYLADAANGLQSWILVWRSDVYAGANYDLCDWLLGGGAKDGGFYDADHQLSGIIYDNDENFFTQPGNGGPSGGQQGQTSSLYIFLESQRINLLATDWNPGAYKGGWVDMTLRAKLADPANILWNQGWIGVQHTGTGAFVSVGHAAANLNNQFQCAPPIFTEVGNEVDPPQ